MVKHIKNFFNGMALGITETVPGVSAGTVAIILGIYGDIITAVNDFTKDYKTYLKFFIPILLGAATGIITFSSIVHFLITTYSFPTMAFFIGLVAGIIPMIHSRATQDSKKLTFKEILLIIMPFLLMVLISNLKESTVVSPEEIISSIDTRFMIFIFFSGVIGAAALVLPGFSGSFLLLLLGIYHVVVYTISTIRILVTDFSNIPLLMDIVKVLGPLGIGMIVGGLSMARLMDKLLKEHYKVTHLLVLGLLMGSVYALFMEPMLYQSGISPTILIIGAATFFAGVVGSFILSKE